MFEGLWLGAVKGTEGKGRMCKCVVRCSEGKGKKGRERRKREKA